MSDTHSGQGNEEIHKDFNFFLTASFLKPLERQVDEMRRLDCVERDGKAVITVGGKRKEIRVKKESLNRKEERFNLGGGRVRADFGTGPGAPRQPTPPSSHTIPPTPPPPPAPHPPPPPPPSSPVLLPHLRPAPTTPAQLPTTQPHQSPTPAAAAARPIDVATAAAVPQPKSLPLPLRRITAQTSVSNSRTSVPNSPRRLRPRKERKTGD